MERIESSIGEPVDYGDPAALVGGRTPVLEQIANAAVAQRLVRLVYEGDGGASTREIEPYALRRAKNGRVYLLAADLTRNGEVRNFRFDRIRQVELLPAPFTPRFAVEFVASPSSSAPASPMRPAQGISRDVSRPAALGPPDYHPRARGGALFSVLCPFCKRRFTEAVYRTALAPHMSEAGAPCEGRHGFPV